MRLSKVLCVRKQSLRVAIIDALWQLRHECLHNLGTRLIMLIMTLSNIQAFSRWLPQIKEPATVSFNFVKRFQISETLCGRALLALFL